MNKARFENLIQSIYPLYNPNMDPIDQLKDICTYLFINDIQGKDVSLFREECLFLKKYEFFSYYLYTRYSYADISMSPTSIWFMDDFLETPLHSKNGYEIEDILRQNYVIQSIDSPDPENGLFWIYFSSEFQANQFIDRLNQFLTFQSKLYNL